MASLKLTSRITSRAQMAPLGVHPSEEGTEVTVILDGGLLIRADRGRDTTGHTPTACACFRPSVQVGRASSQLCAFVCEIGRESCRERV